MSLPSFSKEFKDILSNIDKGMKISKMSIVFLNNKVYRSLKHLDKFFQKEDYNESSLQKYIEKNFDKEFSKQTKIEIEKYKKVEWENLNFDEKKIRKLLTKKRLQKDLINSIAVKQEYFIHEILFRSLFSVKSKYSNTIEERDIIKGIEDDSELKNYIKKI